MFSLHRKKSLFHTKVILYFVSRARYQCDSALSPRFAYTRYYYY